MVAVERLGTWSVERFTDRKHRKIILSVCPKVVEPAPCLLFNSAEDKRTEGKYLRQEVPRSIGGFLCVANTSRPNLSKAFGNVARHAHDATARHCGAVKNILFYLKGTREVRITAYRDAPDELQAFAYSSYAPHCENIRRTSGSVLCLTAVPSCGSRERKLTFAFAYRSGIYSDDGFSVECTVRVRSLFHVTSKKDRDGSIWGRPHRLLRCKHGGKNIMALSVP